MFERIKRAYFILWSDTFYFHRKKKDDDSLAFFDLNLLFGLQIFSLKSLYNALLKINFNLLDNMIIDSIILFTTYVGIPLLLNYFIIYKKKDEIIKKYIHKNGKLFMYYRGIFFGILFALIITGIIIAS